MRTKHLCVLIHIRIKAEVGSVKHVYMFKPSSNFLTDCSKAVLLLWIPFVISVGLCHTVLQHCGHLLGKGWSIGSLVCDVFLYFCHFPIGVLVTVWYLIASIPDLCHLPYLVTWTCYLFFDQGCLYLAHWLPMVYILQHMLLLDRYELRDKGQG